MRDTRGVVFVEFLLAFIPLFTLFLGTVQACLIYAADLIVQHGADRGVRAAVVILEDEERHYGGAPRGVIRHEGEPTERLVQIRQAVDLALWPILPSLGELAADYSGDQSVRTALEKTAVDPLVHMFASNLDPTTAVAFPIASGDDVAHQDTVPGSGLLTLRVHYLYHCGIPLAALLMCDRLTVDRNTDTGVALRSVGGTVTNLDPLLDAPRPDLLGQLAVLGGSWRLLRAESSLPSQGANYAYAEAQQ